MSGARGCMLVLEDSKPAAHAIVRASQPHVDCDLAKTAAAITSALRAGRRWDGAVIDQWLPDADGVDVAAELRMRDASPLVIVVTGEITHDLVNRCVCSGLQLLSRVGENFSYAISEFARAVSRGVDPKVAFELKAVAVPWRLSAREFDVALEFVVGHARKEVARRLRTSENTVKTHVGAILQKSGFASMDDLRWKVLRAAKVWGR